jgi:UDP-GlcNAc:undecaprenyl-phosphate GlcNAc-1-phosphate transferase
MSGKPIFKPDRGHLHHRLLDLGFTQKQAVLLMYVISGVLGLSAIALTEVSSGFAIAIIIIVMLVIFLGARKLGILKHKKSVGTN